MLHRLLRCQDQSENVRVELAMKLALRRLFERCELVDAGVVYQNIEPAECFPGLREKAFDVFLLRNISLDGDRFSAALGNFVNDLVRALL